ncbi:MAG TPA: hypothetical protein VGK37_00805 [Casimicrobiaceae bacterium]|jgi:adenosylmethionine-8-amino-7-oxononanoate aminotransferase
METPRGSPAAAPQRDRLLRPIGRAVYRMPPYCLTDDEMAMLAARTLEIVECTGGATPFCAW